MIFPKLHVLRLKWRVLHPIHRVPAFQGFHWSAMFRHAYRRFLTTNEEFHRTGIVLEPADFDVAAYKKGDLIETGLIVPVGEAKRLTGVLAEIEAAQDCHSHFSPGRTIRLVSVHCRVTGKAWPGGRPLDPTDVSMFCRARLQCRRHELVFYAPLRLTRPAGAKDTGRYCDPSFFRTGRADDSVCKALGLKERLQLDTGRLKGRWLDTTYGRGVKSKTIGGFVGRLPLVGELNEADALSLLLGSFRGIGKNTACGMGVYALEGRDEQLGITPLNGRRPIFPASVGMKTMAAGRRRVRNPKRELAGELA